ncbi:MAG: prepilin-type N-terminal cleavage/methylation domain-containing protein [Oscillospiraceae bacterium]|nr:prepilin-type N-terminal cleavage/methylation domain-containing protein [Oscillospiraceae bacterium]
MKFIQPLKNKKGFTLMELIIVIVILAILAAALIPTFIGFARNARASVAIADARTGITAAQGIVTQLVAANQFNPVSDDINAFLFAPAGTPNARWARMFAEVLAEDDLQTTQFARFTIAPPADFDDDAYEDGDIVFGGNRVDGVEFANGEFLVTIEAGNTDYVRYNEMTPPTAVVDP